MSGGPLTVAQYATGTWIEKRKELDLDWRNDLGRLKHHVLPMLGKLPLSEVSAPHIVALVHKLRTSRRRPRRRRSRSAASTTCTR